MIIKKYLLDISFFFKNNAASAKYAKADPDKYVGSVVRPDAPLNPSYSVKSIFTVLKNLIAKKL